MINAFVGEIIRQNVYLIKKTNKVKTFCENKKEVELERELERLKAENLKAKKPETKELKVDNPITIEEEMLSEQK